MKLPSALLGLLILVNCGTPSPKTDKEIIVIRDTLSQNPPPVEEIILPKVPESAVMANYKNGAPPFYAYVDDVDVVKKITTIRFENDEAPLLIIKESFGARIESLRFPEFESDLILVTAMIKDPNFNKYYLYQLEGNHWTEVVNGWAIHKDNRPDTLQPVTVSSEKSDHMHRYYSVFDLDKESELGYTWRLLEETIPILGK